MAQKQLGEYHTSKGNSRMKFLALISGGKDSFFNIHHCLTQGHDLVALGNLYPSQLEDEIDSFMFQTVGHDIISYYSKCLEVPLYRQPIEGKSKNQDLEYAKTEDDEIEDLYKLIQTIITHHPDIEGVSCGAILSHYQRTRVENVCDRLGLTSLAFLWQRPQEILMQEMCQSQLDARIIKVAAIGLLELHLGKSISELYPHLIKLNQLYDVHVCGEGGEFETIVLDCKFFKNKRLSMVDMQVINHSGDVSYLKFKVNITEKSYTDSFQSIPVPNLLGPEFEALVPSSCPLQRLLVENNDTSNQLDYSIDKYISHVDNILYISNLTSTSTTLREQITNIFIELQTILKYYKLSYDSIQHITLLLSDMTKFTEINSIYQQHFKHYLPPSRICIETKLPTSLQLSCKCIKREMNSKKGIHIRSRSYWAPPNIGPYSQARVEEQLDFNYATISGQIPLNPASMELIASEDEAILLSLQHFHRIKSLINVTEISKILCFITDKINIVNLMNLWKAYCLVEETEETFRKITILKVTGLPRNSIVEIGGETFRKINEPFEDIDSECDKGKANVISQLKEQFSDTTLDVFNTRNSAVLFINSVERMQKLLHTISNHGTHIKIYSNPGNYVKISNYNFEYMPVLNVFDYKLQEVNYGVYLTLET